MSVSLLCQSTSPVVWVALIAVCTIVGIFLGMLAMYLIAVDMRNEALDALAEAYEEVKKAIKIREEATDKLNAATALLAAANRSSKDCNPKKIDRI